MTVSESLLTVAVQVDRSPFGAVVVSEGIFADENPFRFSTKFQDEETELVMCPVRPYSPQLSRFIGRDPLLEEAFSADSVQSESLENTELPITTYVFVDNEPIAHIDPFGLWKWKGGKRQGKSRATIISEQGDTVRSLAQKVRLEEFQSHRWLRDVAGKALIATDNIASDCEYTVPNVFVIAVGQLGLKGVRAGAYDFFANPAADRARALGLEVHFLSYEFSPFDQSDLKSEMTPDVWGVVMVGHGAVSFFGKFGQDIGYFAIDDVYDFRKTDLPSHDVAALGAVMCSAYHHGWCDRVSDAGVCYATRTKYSSTLSRVEKSGFASFLRTVKDGE